MPPPTPPTKPSHLQPCREEVPQLVDAHRGAQHPQRLEHRLRASQVKAGAWSVCVGGCERGGGRGGWGGVGQGGGSAALEKGLLKRGVAGEGPPASPAPPRVRASRQQADRTAGGREGGQIGRQAGRQAICLSSAERCAQVAPRTQHARGQHPRHPAPTKPAPTHPAGRRPSPRPGSAG